MTDPSPRQRRSLLVVLLDAMLGLATAVQTGNVPSLGRRRTRIAWLVVGAVAAVTGTALLVTALVRPPEGLAGLPPAAAAGPAASAGTTAPGVNPSSPSAAATSTRPAASPSRSPAIVSTAPATSAGSSPAPPRLSAHYAVVGDSTGLLGYRATVTIASTGPKTGWRLTLTLPRPTLQVAAVSGATATQDGSTWTFTPVEATRGLTASTPVKVAFDVRGATLVDAEPTDCRVDDQACTGLPT